MENADRSFLRRIAPEIAVTCCIWIFSVIFISECNASLSPESLTRIRMNSLKTAIVNYNWDLGCYPFSGTDKDDCHAYVVSPSAGLGLTAATNCLCTVKIAGFDYLDLAEVTYARRWKGPYIDDPPENLLFDAWGMPIVYLRHEGNLILWSAGADGKFAEIKKIMEDLSASASSLPVSSASDDIACRVGKFKTRTNNTRIREITRSAYKNSRRNFIPDPMN